MSAPHTAENDALLAAADFIEATSGIGARTSDYADGWYDGLSYALAELRSRAGVIPPAMTAPSSDALVEVDKRSNRGQEGGA